MTYLELAELSKYVNLASLSKYVNKDIDIDKLADCYKTVTFTENSDGSFLLDSPYAIRIDKEASE